MPVISKELFYSRIGTEIKCQHIHNWDENCWRAYVFCAHQIFLGGLKFFFPIYVIKAILRHKKLKHKEFLRKIVLEEFRSALYAVTLGLPIFVTNCILCKLTGRLHYYNLGLVAGIFSGFGLLIETKENRMLDTLIFFNLLVEAAFRNMHRFDILKLTRTKETVIFMLVSSLLMHVLQNRQKNYKLTNFWFYMPELHGSETSSKKHGTLSAGDSKNHEEKCLAFAFEGLQKYFLLGYGFSIIKQIIPNMLRAFQNPKLLNSLIIRRENAKFGAFIGAYVGIYRYVSCYLHRNRFIKTELISAVAGFLSGSMYSVSPNIQVLSVGITTLLQIGFNHYLQEFKVKNKEIPQLLVYIISHSLLLHNAIMAKETCPSYYVNMLNVATNNLFQKIYDVIVVKYIFS